eukprot:TRINITY_DN8515_c0_g1_i2.p1 TRINITY_DN8515_c0_g1~~TRINITY_DN8515_c0_g1_i2.p1  ORF type:complete len:153 (+),score=17.40 TRINITY_DN8515_c0_g1_i2:87-545(+)
MDAVGGATSSSSTEEESREPKKREEKKKKNTGRQELIDRPWCTIGCLNFMHGSDCCGLPYASCGTIQQHALEKRKNMVIGGFLQGGGFICPCPLAALVFLLLYFPCSFCSGMCPNKLSIGPPCFCGEFCGDCCWEYTAHDAPGYVEDLWYSH